MPDRTYRTTRQSEALKVQHMKIGTFRKCLTGHTGLLGEPGVEQQKLWPNWTNQTTGPIRSMVPHRTYRTTRRRSCIASGERPNRTNRTTGPHDPLASVGSPSGRGAQKRDREGGYQNSRPSSHATAGGDHLKAHGPTEKDLKACSPNGVSGPKRIFSSFVFPPKN